MIRLNSGNLGPQKIDSGVFIIIFTSIHMYTTYTPNFNLRSFSKLDHSVFRLFFFLANSRDSFPARIFKVKITWIFIQYSILPNNLQMRMLFYRVSLAGSTSLYSGHSDRTRVRLHVMSECPLYKLIYKLDMTITTEN